MKASLLPLVFLLGGCPLLARAADDLPTQLSGRWTALVPGGRTVVDSFTMKFSGDRKPGPVTATLNWRGLFCGAEDETVSGTWDGRVIRFESVLRSNVNVQRNGGQCGDGKLVGELQKNPTEDGFTGEARLATTGASVTLTATSPKR
jgi:hypothetical protein